MPSVPQPLFESYRRFVELNFHQLSQELPAVVGYLENIPAATNAREGYLAVRGFLKSYAGNEATFNSYRTHVERLLLWSLLVAKKPLLELRRSDAEQFMEFCLRPPEAWIGPVVKSRFLASPGAHGTEGKTFHVNPAWRPLSQTAPKRQKHLSEPAPLGHYKMAQGSVA